MRTRAPAQRTTSQLRRRRPHSGQTQSVPCSGSQAACCRYRTRHPLARLMPAPSGWRATLAVRGSASSGLRYRDGNIPCILPCMNGAMGCRHHPGVRMWLPALALSTCFPAASVAQTRARERRAGPSKEETRHTWCSAIGDLYGVDANPGPGAAMEGAAPQRYDNARSLVDTGPPDGAGRVFDAAAPGSPPDEAIKQFALRSGSREAR